MTLPAPSRRSVLGAAVWSVPVVSLASASPAFADSGECVEVEYTFDWGVSGWLFDSAEDAWVGEAELANPAHSGPADPLLVMASSEFQGSSIKTGTTEGYTNMGVTAGQVGGTSQRGLSLIQSYTNKEGVPTDEYQEVTFRFSRAVKNLQFTITDIDEQPSYMDHVAAPGAVGGSYDPDHVAGAGTLGDPWRPVGQGIHDNATSSNGNVVVTYDAVPRNEAQVRFWNGLTSNRGLHGIFIARMSFTAMSCTPTSSE